MIPAGGYYLNYGRRPGEIRKRIERNNVSLNFMLSFSKRVADMVFYCVIQNVGRPFFRLRSLRSSSKHYFYGLWHHIADPGVSRQGPEALMFFEQYVGTNDPALYPAGIC